MKLRRFGFAPLFVVALGLSTAACLKKDEQPKTEETNSMAPSNTGDATTAPAEGGAATTEGAAPTAPAEGQQ